MKNEQTENKQMTIGQTENESMSSYQKLKQQIEYHMDRYYNQDRPEISDYEYDQLMLQLKEMERMHPQWVTPDSPTQKVGGSVKREAGVTVTHNVPMLSIMDVFSKEEVEHWVSEVKSRHADAAFSVERKIDGLSMTLRYAEGRLVLAETRGNGLEGEDVTLNAITIPDVAKTFPLKGYVELRGEVYMSHEDFDRFNEKQEELGKKQAANPRNLAAGTLRQLDPEITKERGLRFMIFNVQAATGDCAFLMESHTQALDWLAGKNMSVVPHKKCTDTEEILAEIDAIGETRGDLDYDLDGAVVKIDRIAYRKDFPAGSKYSAGHIAYKYPPEEKEVVIEEIEVDVGRTGKLTFRARFKEPVRLCGTNVLRATLHNADFIRNMGISNGCKAICRKQGEIIPAIVSVTQKGESPFTPPTTCPKCGHTLFREEGTCDIVCRNPACPAQLKRTIGYFVGKDAMDMKAFGQTYVNELVEHGYLHDAADIYLLKDFRDKLIWQGIMGKEKNTDKILSAIEESKKKDVSALLTGLAIPNVGKTSAKEIMKHFSSLQELASASTEQLLSIPDIGEVTAQAICDYFKDSSNRERVRRLQEYGLNMTSVQTQSSAELAGLTFVITGTLPTLGRKEATEFVESHGGKCTGSVSKKTNYLIAGEEAGSKLEKEKELGIPILTEEELFLLAQGKKEN